MRIVVVHSFYSNDAPSGENTAVLAQARALEADGHDVQILARHTDDLRTRPHYPVACASRLIVNAQGALGGILSKLQPDIVHLHNVFPNWSTGWLEEWGPRTIHTVHNFRATCAGGFHFREGAECFRCLSSPVLPAVRYGCYRGSPIQTVPVAVATRPGGLLRRPVERAGRLIVLNEQMRDHLNRLGRSSEIIPNFVEAHDFSVHRQRSGWLYVGRLSEEKGIVRLIQNWPDRETLTILGAGPQESAIERMVRAPNRLLGREAPAKIRELMASSEGLIVPSLWAEGLPTVILEALSVGTPVLVSEAVSVAASMAQANAGVVLPKTFAVNDLESAMKETRLRADTLQLGAHSLFKNRYSQAAWLTQFLALAGTLTE